MEPAKGGLSHIKCEESRGETTTRPSTSTQRRPSQFSIPTYFSHPWMYSHEPQEMKGGHFFPAVSSMQYHKHTPSTDFPSFDNLTIFLFYMIILEI